MLFFGIIAVGVMLRYRYSNNSKILPGIDDVQDKLDVINIAFVVSAMCLSQSDIKSVVLFIAPLYLATTIVLCLRGQNESREEFK